MRSSLARRAIAVTVLLAQFPFLTVLIFAQQQSSEESRPRRAQEPGKQAANATPGQATWRAPASTTVVGPADGTSLTEEPKIRVALSTNARSATVSTSGQLMSAADSGNTLIPLEVARVRLEPRLLSPLPPVSSEDTYRVQVGGSASQAEAEQRAREIRETIGEESQLTLHAETQTWGLLVGPPRTRVEAEELGARLNVAGYDAAVFKSSTPAAPGTTDGSKSSKNASISQPMQPPGSGLRLAARTSLPSREVVAFASGATRSFRSSAPVLLASEDEAKAPVRYNDRPYRGKIEVFANPRGSLTVVNVLGLEDYVRGVVANELSPGGYPALEALKAQAIAARTYALRNKGQFMAQGFDLLPTTRSQVYRGLSSEHPLSTRAVDETRGIVATYNGEPINALYTSTCGGRTENVENIFNEAVPYLRGHECAAEGTHNLASFIIKTTREPAEIRDERNLPLSRDQALLAVQNFPSLPARLSDSWLASAATLNEVRQWLASVARISKQVMLPVPDDVNQPAPFATALASAVFGESRADTLLNNTDVDYFLAIRDASDVPASNRADVAMLVRDGYLSIFPDATLRPREKMSRGRVLHTISRLLEARSLLQIQKGTARPTSGGNLILRTPKGRDLPIRISSDVYLFRQIGEGVYPVSSVALVGGEPVTFHVNGTGEVDYLEVRPAPNGAAAERSSPFTNWATTLSIGQVQARLARVTRGIGPIIGLRVAARGSSRRVIDLEIIGNQGTAHVRGGRIRSILGLREQLFVIDRQYESDGQLAGFTFTGRGWGHGVGMCQVGAYGLARQGLDYAQILKIYYSGIEMTKLY